MPAVQLKELLNTACKVVDNTCIIVPSDHLNLCSNSCFQPFARHSSQMPWTSKFLTNLKILLLFWNVLKVNFLRCLAWKIFKELNVVFSNTKYLLLHRLRQDFAKFDWLFVFWVCWHINLCKLFNAKCIFIQINSSISNNSVYHKYTV